MFGGHNHADKLRCPYNGCGKSFDKPTVLTDHSKIPSNSYYACPFCMSKIDLITQNMHVVDVKPVDYPPTVFESPAKCAHYNGLLGMSSGPLPDECLVCPKVMQCEARRR